MRKILAGIAALGIAATAAQARAATNDTQYWQTVSASVNLGDGFQVSNETVFRSSDRRGFYEIENNLMAGYAVSKHVVVWLGYTHDPNYSHGDFTVMEHRFRQQVNFEKYKVGNLALSGRIRTEQRWREGVSATGWRARPYVKAALPVAGKGKTQAVVTNEAFFNLNTTPFQRKGGLDRTRTFVGINQSLARNLNLEAGYMLQHGYVRNAPDTNDHILTVALSAKF